MAGQHGSNLNNFDEGIRFPKVRVHDADDWVGSKHNTNSSTLMEVNTTPNNHLRVFRAPGSPFLLFQSNANEFPSSRYWR